MKLFVSALEASSNLHLSFLLKELRSRTDVRLFGVFDRALSADLPQFEPQSFAIMGFVDVFKKLPFLLSAAEKLAKTAAGCDKIVLMDSSSFHIPLAKKIKKINPNAEIMYYILPQVWAWKPWRVRQIERYFDKLAAILPFEVALYSQKARFVGHPLLDEITRFRGANLGADSPDFRGSKSPQDSSRRQDSQDSKDSRAAGDSPRNTPLFLPQDSRQNLADSPRQDSALITFMPGSRRGEIARIFPTFRAVKNALKARDSRLSFNLVVPRFFKNENLAAIYGDLSDFNVVFDAHESLFQSRFAFICSGTATLEAALIGAPFVLAYRAKWLDAAIVRLFLNIKFVGLANILYRQIHANAAFHEELLQEKMTLENLLKAYERELLEPQIFAKKAAEIRHYLGGGSAKNTALWLLDKMGD